MCYSPSYDDAPVYKVLYERGSKMQMGAKELVSIGTVQAWSQREALRLASERFNIPAAATAVIVASYSDTEAPLVEPLDPAQRRRPVKRTRG